MRAGRGVVQIVTGYDFVFDSFVVHFDAVISIITPKHEQVLNSELLCLGPTNLQPSLIHLAFAFQLLAVQQIKHLFVVDLQERTGNSHCFAFVALCLCKDFSDGSHGETNVHVLGNDWLDASAFLGVFVFVAFHGVGLSGAGLAVCEDRCVEA